MSDVIRLLETLACNPSSMTEEAFIQAVAQADLSPEVRAALLRRDVEAVSRAVGGRGVMLCLVYPADNDEQPKEDEPGSEEETPDDESKARAA